MTAHSALESQSSFSPHGELRTAFYNPHEIKRRRRTSRSQFKTLEKAFCENPKPNASTRRHLAQSLSMTPRGIQVWFQNRRAKSKQVSNMPQDHIGADDTKSHDEVSRMDKLPFSQAQDGNPFRDICQESKEGASFQQQESTSSAASSSLSLVVTAPVLTSLGRQTTDTAVPDVTDAMSSFSDGEHTNAHHSTMHLTWDPSQNWQNTPNVASLSQTSPSIKSSTEHRKESVRQSTPGIRDESVEHFMMLQCNAPTNFSQSTSAKAPSDGQEDQAQHLDSMAARYHSAIEAAMNAKNCSSPSTLSLMRRMSMPTTIGSDKASDSNAWIGLYPLHSTLDLQQPVVHMLSRQSHSQAPFSIPQHPSSNLVAVKLIHPLADHEGKGGLLDNRARNRSYPLLRRVSIHETGNISAHTNYKAKFTQASDLPGAQPSEIGSLAAAAAARRRRRSSVSKPAHISASEFSTIAESPSGNTTTFHLASSAEECSRQEQGLKADTLLDRNTSSALQDRAQSIMASSIGYNGPGIWIHDYLNQQQPVSDSLIPPTLGLLNFSTGYSLSDAEVAGIMAEREESVPHQLQPTPVIDSATPSTDAIEAPHASKTGRRRSSLKTGRTRPQSGTRVQFDVQPLTPLTQQCKETQDREEISSSMELGKPQTFNGLPKQETAWDPWSPATHQEASKSTPPVEAPESQVASSESAQSFFPCGTLPELNQCLPDQAQSQVLQDSQQLRRNSCPPEFIECFSRGLQIIPEAQALEEDQQAFMHGLQSEFQQKAQHQYSLHMQSLQMQHQQHLQQQQPQQQPQPQQQQPQQLMAWADNHQQRHLLSEGPAPFQMPHGLATSQDNLGLGAMSLDEINAVRAPTNLGKGRGDMDSRSIRRMNLSDLGPRQQPMDSHILPQLQTPRLLAQLQHQIGHPSWSRTMSLNTEPLAGRSRPALPDTFQNAMVRRYSEPGKGFEMTTDAATLCYSGAGLADAVSGSTIASTTEQHESAQHQAWGDDVALTKQIPLPGQSLEYPFSKTLHPLEVAMTSIGPNSAPDTMTLSAPTAPLNRTSPSTGPQMTFFPSSISITSTTSSLSPSDSPLSSPLSDKHYNQEFSSAHTASPASSVNASSTFDISSPMRGSSVPTCGSSSMTVALGHSHSLEAPLLMRAHSLDSLMLQVHPRDPQITVINSGESSPLRRHSQGHALMNSAPNTTVQPYQSNTPTPGRELAQQVDQHSYFSLTFQPYPSPSTHGAQAPLDIHPLEQQYHYQQQQTYSQLPSTMAQQPSTLPSPPYASPTYFPLQYDASGLPVRLTAAAHIQEAVQSLESKERMTSARALSHFESMQQSLPHTKHQRRHLTRGPRRPGQGLQIAQEQPVQLQQQQQPSPVAEWSMSLNPLPTTPAFRDPRAFEEYKHQQFLLEHKRLQQQELTEQEQQQQQQQQQECEVATSTGQDHSMSAGGLPARSAQNAPYRKSS